MTAEIARAACGEAEDCLQELEVDVAVAVVVQALGAKEEFGTCRGGMARGVDIAQVVLVRYVTGPERYAIDWIAILHGCRKGGGIVRGPAGGRIGGERIDDEGAGDPGEIRGSGRRQRWDTG